MKWAFLVGLLVCSAFATGQTPPRPAPKLPQKPKPNAAKPAPPNSMPKPAAKPGGPAAQVAPPKPPNAAYNLGPCYGQDVEPFLAELKAKLKKEVNLVPKAVAGKNYTQEELAKLPKVKEVWYSGPVKNLGEFSMRRSSAKPLIVFTSYVFPVGKVKTVAQALERIGVPAVGVTPKKDADGGFAFQVTLSPQLKLFGWFHPANPDFKKRPFLELSLE